MKSDFVLVITKLLRLSCSEESWFYYNTKAEIDRLISSLNVHDENESALKQKLKALKKQTKKLHFEKRCCILTFDKRILCNIDLD